jgi:hypothetical protein
LDQDDLMRWYGWVLAGILAAGTGLACDDKNDVPPEVLKAQSPTPAKPAGPTTRALLTSPRQTLRLSTLPLSLEVPKSWGLKSLAQGEVITVSGPATSGDIDIQLVQQNQTVDATAPEATLATIKAEMKLKPHPINRAELRTLGPAKVLEVRMISNAFENGRLAPEVWGDVEVPDSAASNGGNKTMTRAILNPHLVKWTFTVYLPAGEKKLSVRTLTFMGLGLHDYERDSEFLEQMMKTLKYEE